MIKLLLPLALCFLLFAGATCERPAILDIEPPAPELVLISTFSPNTPFSVSVSTTRSALTNSTTDYVQNAEVSIWQGNSLLERLPLIPGSGSIAPYYRGWEYKPEANTIYTIKVVAPGFNPVVAQSSIPSRVAIQRIDATFTGMSPSNTPQELIFNYNVLVTFDDPPTSVNYYHLRFHQETLEYLLTESGDTSITGRSLQHLNFAAAINNNTITAYLDDGVLFEDELFNGRRVSFTFPVQVRINTGRELPGNLYAELRTASESYYRFYSSVGRNQDHPGPPYTEPVIVYSNVDQGRGIFAGFNTYSDSIRLIR